MIVPLVLELYRPSSVVDIGTGTGTWLAVFAEHGIADIHGVDGDWVDRSTLEIPEQSFTASDLTDPPELGRTYDLVVSLEVAEHLPAEAAGSYVKALTGYGPVCLFSAAIPHQGGTNHVNEQWPDYWAALFDERGFVPVDCLRRKIWDDERVEWWYAQNIVLYCSRTALAQNPALQRESELTGPSPQALVHPKRFLELVEWAVEGWES